MSVDLRTSGAEWAPLGDLDEFGSRYWDRAPLHRAGAGGLHASAVLSLEELDRLITSRNTYLRLSDGGVFLDDEGHREAGGAGGGLRIWRSDTSAVLAAFRQGRTIFVPAVHELWPPIDVLASRLSGQLHATVQASLFVSTGDALTDWHADESHGVVLQLHGTKHWLVERDGPAGTPQSGPALNLRLRPGDVLYVPQRFLHRVRCEGGLSVHVTFSCSTPTWAELGQAALTARSAALFDAQLRRSVIDPAWGPRSKARWTSELRGMVQALHTAVDALNDGDFAAAQDPSQQRPTTHDRGFLDACAALSISAHSPVRVRPGLEISVTKSPGTLTLRFDDRCLEMPIWLASTVASLLDDPARVLTSADLPLEAADATVFVRRLVAEGLLEHRAAEKSQP